MVKPDDIPQDIWENLPRPHVTYADHSYPAYSAAQMARAVLAERNRCAGIASSEFLLNRNGEVCIIDDNACPSRILKAIRDGS